MSALGLVGPPANAPNLVHIFGSMPVASRMRMGMCGLCFFIVGYARLRNDLCGRSPCQSCTCKGGNCFVEGELSIPRCVAGLRGMAEMEADLSQARSEGILSGHDRRRGNLVHVGLCDSRGDRRR